jgi:pyrimidine-nucleoside phosphorylase
LSGIVFDLRVPDWPKVQSLKRAMNLSRTLQNICDQLLINSSVFLCNGYQPLGNALGARHELIEAGEVLKGKGPYDLQKYALEVGTDLLLATKMFQQKWKAKKFIKDQIIKGKTVHGSKLKNGKWPSRISSNKHQKISSPRKGYIHFLSMEALHKTKLKFGFSCPGNGINLLKKIGDRTEKGDHLVEIFGSQRKEISQLRTEIQKAYMIFPKPPDFQPLILEKSGLRLHL